MRSIQTVLKSYTSPRHRLALTLLTVACAIPIVTVVYQTSSTFVSDPIGRWVFAFLATSMCSVAIFVGMAMRTGDMIVGVEDLAALPAHLRAPVDAWLLRSSNLPLDWGTLRQIGDEQAHKAFVSAQERQAQSKLARQRAAVATPAVKAGLADS